MAYDFQIAVDATRPHVLAGWWAAALGWTVEVQDAEFIRRMIAEGYATEADTTTHNGALAWKDGAAIRHPAGPGGEQRSRIFFQQVPESKTVKNRIHLDIQVGPGQVEAEAARLTDLGATFLHRCEQGPHGWITLADPEGNEFCVT